MKVRRSLVVLAVFAACRGTEPGGVTVAVTSVPTTPGTVVFEVHNAAAEPASIERCNYRIIPVVDSAHSGNWVNASWPICPAIFNSSPLSLASGGIVSDSVVVAHSGTYRLGVGYGPGVARVLIVVNSQSFVIK